MKDNKNQIIKNGYFTIFAVDKFKFYKDQSKNSLLNISESLSNSLSEIKGIFNDEYKKILNNNKFVNLEIAPNIIDINVLGFKNQKDQTINDLKNEINKKNILIRDLQEFNKNLLKLIENKINEKNQQELKKEENFKNLNNTAQKKYYNNNEFSKNLEVKKNNNKNNNKIDKKINYNISNQIDFIGKKLI